MAESERSQEDRETAAVLTPPSSQEKEESTVLEQTELVQKALEDALLASGIGKEIDSEQQDSNQQKTEVWTVNTLVRDCTIVYCRDRTGGSILLSNSQVQLLV